MIRIYLSLCFFISSVVCFEETCNNTVDGSSGSCINIYNCDVLLELVKQRSNENDELLRNSKCGLDSVDLQSSSNDFNPKVCCPSEIHIQNSTPNANNTYNEKNKSSISEVKENEEEEICNNTVDGSLGSCMNIYNCDVLLKLVKQRSNENDELLRNSKCGIDSVDLQSSSNSFPTVCCPSGKRPLNAAPTATSIKSREPKKTINGIFVDLPEPPICGTGNGEFTRVVNGVPASLGAFPWMALLGYGNRTNYKWECGGSLISSRHVLTAAHCILNELYLARLGELDSARDDDGATPIDLLIVSTVKYEKYDTGLHTGDIGILTLEHTVPFTNLIRPICIPVTPELRIKTFENHTPFVAGWGVDITGVLSTRLQVAQVEVVSNARCTQDLKDWGRINEGHVCAVGEKQEDACKGDSGGPLMQPVQSTNREFYFYEIGVISTGRGCGDGFPGIYTRVTHYLSWITEKVTGRS